jgi:hypothetical protein
MPLAAEADDLLERFIRPTEGDLGHRQDFRKTVAPQRHVQLAADDEFLDQRRLAVIANAGVDALAQALSIFHDRRQRDPTAAVLGHRLDDRRQRHARRTAARVADDLVGRRLQPGGFQRPFRDQFAARPAQRHVRGSGVHESGGAHQARHFRLGPGAAAEALAQVEDHVPRRIVAAQHVPQIVPHRRQLDRAHVLAQRLTDRLSDSLRLGVRQDVFGAPAFQTERDVVQHHDVGFARIARPQRTARRGAPRTCRALRRENRGWRSETAAPLRSAGAPLPSRTAQRIRPAARQWRVAVFTGFNFDSRFVRRISFSARMPRACRPPAV